MSGEISIIYPPPEIRNIVDKTASFVARNGPEFESRIQQNEPNNRKFNFLKPGDPYNAYYQFKVKEFRDAAISGTNSGTGTTNDVDDNKSAAGGPINGHAAPEPKPATASSETPSVAGINDGKPATPVVPPETKHDTKRLENIMEQPIILRGAPPPYEFSDDAPSISAYELEVVKLTAQFVAIHGRSFLNALMNKESRNYQFDFLRPQHGLFTYFTQLIEQYSKVLMPAKPFLQMLEKEAVDSKVVLEKVRYRAEWTKVQEAEKRREEEEAEKERIQYAQIDWHDFVIVETVDYQPHETGNFPPPTTPEQVGTRLLLQQRIEANGTETIEMDVDSDEEKAEDKAAEAEKEKTNEPLIPLPPSLDNVLIRKDYNPKAAGAAQAAAGSAAPSGSRLPDNYVISPITGEKIPADKLQEHMRFSLLDPRWVAERDRTIQDKMQQEEVYAPGSAIESSLKHLAERRTDIFGSGDEETIIGRKIGEEEQQRKLEKVTWDGHMNSVEATTRAARANISIEEQIQHIHKVQGLLPDDGKDRIGPNVVPGRTGGVITTTPNMGIRIGTPILATPSRAGSMMPPPMPPPPPQHQRADYGAPMMHHQHPHLHQQMHSYGGLAPPPPPMMPGTPQGMPPMPPPPPMAPAPPMLPMAVDQVPSGSAEPAYKKARTEDNLVPEEEFLKTCASPNVTIKVQVLQSTEKPEWKLNGQVINLTLPYTDALSVVKAKIHELTNLPPGKQKLQYEGIFLKDQNSLAFYNLPNGAPLVLGLKERGGRKK